MVNGLGVVGWGVGGIEAEAALLGQPVSLLTPKVIGVELTGELQPGTTATDLVLTVTELLRQRGVVGKFVEFYGPGVAEVSAREPGHARQHVAGVRLDGDHLPGRRRDACATCASPGGPPELVDLVEAYTKEQGLWHEPDSPPTFSDTLQLDLSTVVPCIAGPSRPQDRVPLDDGKAAFRAALPSSIPPAGGPPGSTGSRCTSGRPAPKRPRPSRSRPATRRRPAPVPAASALPTLRATAPERRDARTGHAPRWRSTVAARRSRSTTGTS